MPETLLRTKLYVPPLRPNLVRRQRLIEQLNRSLQPGQKMTLISAPAGFGKTTLASEWLAGCKHPAAWLSLDESDNEPTRFLTYFVAALQTIGTDIGKEVLGMLQSAEPPPTESILTTLLNEISTFPGNFLLVLDDYHLIDAQPVDASTSIDGVLTFVLEHSPPQLHLVIATREDPPLPLARYRVRGQLTELRVIDLRFSRSEAADFLNQEMGLNLSGEEIAALETRTEGWIAGLQMAALSMHGRTDTASFVRAFTGSHRFVMDYLVEEILQQQPEGVRSFLLKTSILDSLCGPLCDAVTGQVDGRRMLAALERDNLFVVPLDDERYWYRYHHLFADVLRTYLMEEQPNQAAALHQAASEWHEEHGLPEDAIRHAFAAEDLERASRLVELAIPVMGWNFQTAKWLSWVKRLPEEQIRTRPVLSVGYAMAMLEIGELATVETRLRDAEIWLEATGIPNERPGIEMVVADEEQYWSLPGKIATIRAYHAQILGDVSSALTYAGQALDLLPEDDFAERGRAAAFQGVAYWARGDLEEAYRSLAEFRANMRMAGNILVALSGTFLLADIRIAQGRLHEAVRTYEQSLQLATAQGEPVLRGTADLYVGLGELLCKQGDLEAAEKHLLTSKALGKQAVLPELQHRSCVAMARIKAVQGELGGNCPLKTTSATYASLNTSPRRGC